MPEKPSTLRRFVQGTLSSGVGGTITIVLGFLCTVIYTRWLPVEDYGIFIAIQLILGLAVTGSSFGIDYAVQKFIAGTDSDDDKRMMIDTTFIFRAITLAVSTLIIFLTKLIIEVFWGATLLTDLLVFLPILLILETYAGILGSILAGNMQFKNLAFFSIIYSITSFIFTVLFIIWWNMGVIGLVYVRILSRLVAFFYAAFSAKIRLRLEMQMDLLKRMLRFGFPLYLNSFLNFGFSKADSFIIGGFLGPAEIAIYETARKIPESLEMLYSSFLNVYFTIVTKIHASGDEEKVAKLLDYANRLLAFGGLLCALIVFQFREEIVVFLFSEQYLPSAPILALLMFGFVLIMLDSNLGKTLVAIGDSDKPPMINVVRTVISFTGYFLLLPSIGTAGAALANILSTAIVNPINVFFLKRRYVKASMLVYLKPIFLYILFLEIIWLFHLFDWISDLIVLLVFIGVSFIIRIFTADDIATLWYEIKIALKHFTQSRSTDPVEEAGDHP